MFKLGDVVLLEQFRDALHDLSPRSDVEIKGDVLTRLVQLALLMNNLLPRCTLRPLAPDQRQKRPSAKATMPSIPIWKHSRHWAPSIARRTPASALATHGGSLRVYAIHADDPRPSTAAVAELLATEQTQGLRDLATYQAFQPRADRVKKQGKYLPGSHIPIRPPAALRDEPLDEVLILP